MNMEDSGVVTASSSKITEDVLVDKLQMLHSMDRVRQSQIGLFITSKCPVGCRHCITSSIPTSAENSDIGLYKRWMEKVVSVRGITRISITGGEPFFVFDKLLHVTKMISNLGLIVDVITSAYWAHDDLVARRILKILASAGMSEIAVSVDKFHQEKIPLEYVIRVLKEARYLGLKTYIQLGYMGGAEDEREKENFKGYISAHLINDVSIIEGEFIHGGRAKSLVWPDAVDPQREDQDLACPSLGLLILDDGRVAACCGAPLPENSPLILGDLNKDDFADIYRRFRDSPLISFIKIKGLKNMLNRLQTAELTNGLEQYAGARSHQICQLCQEILSREECVTYFISEYSKSDIRRELAVMKFLLYGDHYCP